MMRAFILNKKFGIFLLFILMGICFGLPIRAQEKTSLTNDDLRLLDLRKKIDELTRQAETYKKNIRAKQQEGNTLQRQISIIESQISSLETQVNITEAQIQKTQYSIEDTEKSIRGTEDQISDKKRLMRGLLTRLYMFDRKPVISMVLQGAKLSEFTNQLQSYDGLVSDISSATQTLHILRNDLTRVQSELAEQKNSLELLNHQRIIQRDNLQQAHVDKDHILQVTKGQEVTYQKMLAETEQRETEFFNQLKDYEAKAISSGSFIVRVVAESVPPRGTKLFDYPEHDGYLTQGYGMTPHARRGAYGGAPHNGIDVSSGTGTPIYSIGPGAILATGFNSGFGNWVAVRHDMGLVSMYGHMRVPSGLANGTRVDGNSIIGYEGTTGNSTGSHVHLSLYKEFFTYLKGGQLYFNYFEGSLNPLDYIK